jgi:hypothetical protein
MEFVRKRGDTESGDGPLQRLVRSLLGKRNDMLGLDLDLLPLKDRKEYGGGNGRDVLTVAVIAVITMSVHFVLRLILLDWITSFYKG